MYMCAQCIAYRCNADLHFVKAEGVFIRKCSIVQDHVEQGLVDPDAAVVFNEAQLAEPVHEKAHARAGSADHLREGFLRDLGNQYVLLARLAEFRHQQKDARQTLFAGIEELIDEICLGTHAALQEKLQKQVGEATFLVHRTDHFIPYNLECSAGSNRGGSRQAPTNCCGKRLFSDKVSSGEDCNGCFLAPF